MDTDVEQDSATHAFQLSLPFLRGPKSGNRARVHEAHFAEQTLSKQASGLCDQRTKSVLFSDGQAQPSRLANLDQLFHVPRIEGNRLLYEYVFPGSERVARRAGVKVMREREDDRIDARIGKRLLDGPKGGLSSEAASKFAGSIEISAREEAAHTIAEVPESFSVDSAPPSAADHADSGC
jgi:hypothetical protein